MKKILIVDNGTDDIVSVQSACKRLGYDYETVGMHQEMHNDSLAFDFVILTGGKWYDDPTQQGQHYQSELELILRSRVPIIGICLGMQLIATAFGGRSMKIKKEHHGRREIELTDAGKESLRLTDDKILTFENHTIGIVGPPDSFDVLAVSDDCIEMIKHKSLPIVGVQFHPEKLNKQEHADGMWRAMLQLIGE